MYQFGQSVHLRKHLAPNWHAWQTCVGASCSVCTKNLHNAGIPPLNLHASICAQPLQWHCVATVGS